MYCAHGPLKGRAGRGRWDFSTFLIPFSFPARPVGRKWSWPFCSLTSPLFFFPLPAFQAPINDSLSALRDVPVDVLFFRRCNFLTMFSVLMEPRLATYSSRETLVAMPANRESRRNRAGMGVSGQGEICTVHCTVQARSARQFARKWFGKEDFCAASFDAYRTRKKKVVVGKINWTILVALRSGIDLRFSFCCACFSSVRLMPPVASEGEASLLP